MNEKRVIDKRIVPLSDGFNVEVITTEVDGFLCENFGMIMSVPQEPKFTLEQERELDEILERLKKQNNER